MTLRMHIFFKAKMNEFANEPNVSGHNLIYLWIYFAEFPDDITTTLIGTIDQELLKQTQKYRVIEEAGRSCASGRKCRHVQQLPSYLFKTMVWYVWLSMLTFSSLCPGHGELVTASWTAAMWIYSYVDVYAGYGPGTGELFAASWTCFCNLAGVMDLCMAVRLCTMDATL